MAAETPEPTLDDLLAACDLAEEAGAPPEVTEFLRAVATRSAGVRPEPGGRRYHRDATPGTFHTDGSAVVMGSDRRPVADCRMEGRSDEECAANVRRIITESHIAPAISGQLDVLNDAFSSHGILPDRLSAGRDLITDGIPALIAEVVRLTEGLHRGRDYVAALEEMVRRRDVALWEQCGVTIAEPSPPARPDVFDPLPPIRLQDTPARRDHAPNHV